MEEQTSRWGSEGATAKNSVHSLVGGGYTTPRKASNRRQGRQTVPWTLEIPNESIILNFQWKIKDEKRTRLPRKIKEKLQELYGNSSIVYKCIVTILFLYLFYSISENLKDIV